MWEHVFFFHRRILGGVVFFRQAFGKSENEFVKQNEKLVDKRGFRFSVRASEQAGLFPQNQANAGFGPRFRKTDLSVRLVPTRAHQNLKPHFEPTFDSVTRMWSETIQKRVGQYSKNFTTSQSRF